MTKYYDHDLWHERKLKEIQKNGFKYKTSQSFFLMDALAYENAPDKPCELLDLGCGIGDISIAFSELGFKVTGLEYSPVAHNKSLELAKQANQDVAFIKGDVLEADKLLPTGKWDFVTAVNLLHCLVDSNDRQKFYAVLRKLIKPGTGKFYLTSMCDIPGKEIAQMTKVDPVTRIGSNGTRIHLEPETIIKELAANGLKIIEHRLFEYTNDTDPGFETREISVLGTLAD